MFGLDGEGVVGGIDGNDGPGARVGGGLLEGVVDDAPFAAGEGEVAAVFGEVGLEEELGVGGDLRGLELGRGGVGAETGKPTGITCCAIELVLIPATNARHAK